MQPTADKPVISEAVQALEMVDTNRAAELIHTSPSWLEHDRLKPKPEIPFVRIGNRLVRYRVRVLLDYANRQTGKPMAA